MIRSAIADVVEGRDLSQKTMRGAMDEIMEGRATGAQVGAFLTGLRLKGETIEEISAAAEVMRDKATPIEVDLPMIVDTCGTGGDGASTFNISTTAAFVVAGAGLPVAKHGNRSVSSRCGSADVLEALGVKLDVDAALIEAALKTAGIGFLFAPAFHPAMKYAIGPRREIGIRTSFNILGPLTNPAGAQAQLLGVYDGVLTEPMAHVLGRLGARRAFVVHGEDGLDEVTLTGSTRVSELREGRVTTNAVRPEDYGLQSCKAEELTGGAVKENAAIVEEILSGASGPRRDVVVLNAAFALVAGGAAENVRAGIELARQVIDKGRAIEKLHSLQRLTGTEP